MTWYMGLKHRRVLIFLIEQRQRKLLSFAILWVSGDGIFLPFGHFEQALPILSQSIGNFERIKLSYNH